MAMKKVDVIWLDGQLLPWDSAQEHVLAHTMHYGVGAFEGIRAYQRADGKTQIFRLREHIDRLLDSCQICTMECTYTREQLIQACIELVKTNKMTSCYLRPLVYLGYGALGLGSFDPPVRSMVACYEWGSYLGEVLRRRYAGAWEMTQYPGGVMAVPAIEVRGSRLFPLMKVYRRLTVGEEEDLSSFYAMVTDRLGKPAQVN